MAGCSEHRPAPRTPSCWRAAGLRRSMLLALKRLYMRGESGRISVVVKSHPVQLLRRSLVRPITERDVVTITGALTHAGVRFWLAGGWGVDALMRRQTRRHKDLDLVVHIADVDSCRAALYPLKYFPVEKPRDGNVLHVPGAAMAHRAVFQDSFLRTVDMHPLEPSFFARELGVASAFSVGVISGCRVPCLSAAAQLATRTGYELRPEDSADIVLLERLA